jgi:cyclopropane-fatty-acyl-phospholipid synthase
MEWHMSARPSPLVDINFQNSAAFLEELFAGAEPQRFAVRFWNGCIWPASADSSPQFTIILNHPGALHRMFASPTELSLGEAYIYGDFDVEGDLESAVQLGNWLIAAHRGTRERLRLRAFLARLPGSGPRHQKRAPLLHGTLHSRERDHDAIRYHYNLSNQFYALFLDSRMNYSAGYFTRPEQDLESAQQQKLDRICRLLELRPGDCFLDVGCGWGGLIIHAAQHFGAKALGITLSERQAELAHERIREAGLESCCQVEVRDYRDLDSTGSFDKIASIGMIEHVGAQQLHRYFRTIWRLLRPGGAFLNSGIARRVGEPAHPKGSFTEAYVFPDGELGTIPETLQAAENAGFELRLAENRREDYALTLRHWVRRLEARPTQARRITDEMTYRIWRLYMAGSAARFMNRELCLLLSLLRKPGALRHSC